MRPRFLISIIFFFSFLSVNAQQKTIEWYTANAPFKMPTVKVLEFKDTIFSIKSYGAISDGQTLNTAAFEKAINACNAAGGGTVLVPEGLWLTGPIQLKSNVNLHLERGALIIFTKDRTQYPIVKTSNQSTNYQPASPIYGYDLKNIAITGEGILDGGGDAWRPVKRSKVPESDWKKLVTSGGVVSNDVWWPSKEALSGDSIIKEIKKKTTKSTEEDYIAARDFLRPHMLYLVNCDDILLEGITIRNSPKFVFYPSKCTNLTMKYVNVYNEWNAQNGDGIDISACENVVIYKCNVSVGDDGICMKSSASKSDAPGTVNLKNVLIAACNVYHAHGGFVIGSNTDGGMQNVYVTDCNYVGTDIGIRVKSNYGRGGLVRDIYLCNIYMRDIAGEAISFDTYYEDMPAGKTKSDGKPEIQEKTPEFRDFHISNVYCNGAKTAVYINGLADMPVKNIFFDHVTISATKGFVANYAANLDLKSVKIIPEVTVSPVYALTNVKGFQLTDGLLPEKNSILVKGDENTSDVKVLSTDTHNIKGVIQVGK
ncbi:glycoside hydrolase family 28 protein [Ferruginibacter albus]|uniref:glycoside hydrolase family 28 protein n=1 Tax=Ferruginibacter albus TaxID=2875540 RepID=UPI001CC57DAC|nr:glycoside hydrolase family 28 protein [Ferruginibacter albus]UAY51452.1 glycoside hydrolase family 28 protein [Ferruginibacter albus]